MTHSQSSSLSKAKESSQVSAGEVRSELARLLGSDEFRATDRSKEMLRFLVEEVLGGNSNQIKGHTIATEVLGRGLEFSASRDPIVSIEIRKLREALEHYYLTEGRSNPVEIDLPKRTYIPRFLPRDNSVTLAGKLRDKVSRWIPVIEVRQIQVGNCGSLGERIGVVLTEEIAAELSFFRELAILVERPGQSGEERQVQGKLCGVFRVSDTKGILTLRLEIAPSGACAWADRFEFSLAKRGHQGSFEEWIARTVAAQIGGDHGAVNRHLIPAVWCVETDDRPLGYEAVMAYYHFDRHRSMASLGESTKLLERACAADPSSGLLKAMLANTRIFQFGIGITDDVHILDEALDLAHAAVRLEPENQMCLETVGLTHFHMGQPEAALESLERALQVNSNSTYRVALIAWDMMLCGNWKRGRELLLSTMARSPGNPSWLWFAICWDDFRLGKYEDALVESNRPDLPNLFWIPLMRVATLARCKRRSKTGTGIGAD